VERVLSIRHDPLCQQSNDRGFNDVLTMTFPKVSGFESARNEAYVAVAEHAAGPQAGVLREDFVPEGLVVLLMDNAGVVAAAGKAAPRAAPRLIGYLLEALLLPRRVPYPRPSPIARSPRPSCAERRDALTPSPGGLPHAAARSHGEDLVTTCVPKIS
jgi:hypothetical protein